MYVYMFINIYETHKAMYILLRSKNVNVNYILC